MTRCHSFDVFDTLLTRTVGAPASLFLFAGARLRDEGIVSCSPEAFRRRRVEAERALRTDRPGGEPTLVEIYERLGSDLGWDSGQARRAMAIEQEFEERHIVPVPGAAARVGEARRGGGRIVFISDMYLPPDFLGLLLARHGLLQDGDGLYLSGEHRASKAAGDLFRLMLSAEELAPSDVTHCGDHEQGDIASPARLGIRVDRFDGCRLNRFERALESGAEATEGLSSLLAGASRLTRLTTPARGPHETAIRDVTAGVLAPTLVCFVLWLLQRAERLGLRRLYFVSRDGQILIRLAETLAPKAGVRCEFRYLYGSRQGWHLPSVARIDETKLEWMFLKYDRISVRNVLFRVGLDPADAAASLAAAGFDAASWDRGLDAAGLARLRALIVESPLRDLILREAGRRRVIVLDYLRQEGLFDDLPWAMVDVGWNGRLQASLADLLREADPSRTDGPIGLYFALNTRPDPRRAGRTEAYLYDPETLPIRTRVGGAGMATIMEMACAADHGTVDGFERVESGVVPVLRERSNTRAIDWGLPVLQESILEFTRRFEPAGPPATHARPMRDLLVTLLHMFWVRPTREEAAAWGGFVFDNDQSGASLYPIADPYSMADVLLGLLGRRRSKGMSSWDAGSLAVSSGPARTVHEAGCRVKRALRTAGRRRFRGPR